MGVDDCVAAGCRDEIDDCGQSCEVGGVQGGGHGSLSETLHKEGNAEDVHAFVHQDLDGRSVGPGVVCSKCAWDIATAEFSSGLVDTEPL